MDDPRFNYKLLIAYDGTNYGGWQIQPNAVSIQSLVQNAASIFVREEVNVIGSGRTDAGVHATGQTAHFKCSKNIDPRKFFISMNGMLPEDIRIMHVEQVPLQFHAQRSAIRKTYHYHLWLQRIRSPFHRMYSLHVHENIDLKLLVEGAAQFIGTHDFTSFANESHSGSAAHDPIRTLEKLDVVTEEGGVRLEFTGTGFLYKMVRNITGTLLDVSRGKIEVTDIKTILEAKDRRRAGQAAPPHGLFLHCVEYPN